MIVSYLLWLWALQFSVGHLELLQAHLAVSLLCGGGGLKFPTDHCSASQNDNVNTHYDVITDVVNVSSMVLETVYIFVL